MSKRLYVIFFKETPKDTMKGTWYTGLRDAVNAYFCEDFQGKNYHTSLRMKRVPDDAGLREFEAEINRVLGDKDPHFYEWITLELREKVDPEEILSRKLAEVQSRLGSSRVEIFKPLTKTRAIVRIDNDYWLYWVFDQETLSRQIN